MLLYQRFQSVLLNHKQKLRSHPARLLGSCLPFFNERCDAGFVEAVHRGLVLKKSCTVSPTTTTLLPHSYLRESPRVNGKPKKMIQNLKRNVPEAKHRLG